MRLVAGVILLLTRVWSRFRESLYRPLFDLHGSNFRFDPDGYYTYETIEVGNDVFIGPRAQLSAPQSRIVIGNKVMLGPNVTIMGGDHNTSQVGRFMFDVKEKLLENDLPVIIEDDVWVGAGATILKGVRLRRGCIVAAGALVTKDVPPYAIVGGVPARVMRFRWVVDMILTHEKLLYPPEERLLRVELEHWQKVNPRPNS